MDPLAVVLLCAAAAEAAGVETGKVLVLSEPDCTATVGTLSTIETSMTSPIVSTAAGGAADDVDRSLVAVPLLVGKMVDITDPWMLCELDAS